MFPPMLPRPSRRSGRQVPCRGQAGRPASASRLPGVSVLAPWPLPAAGRLRPYRGPLVQTHKPADRQLYVPGDAGGGGSVRAAGPGPPGRPRPSRSAGRAPGPGAVGPPGLLPHGRLLPAQGPRVGTRLRVSGPRCCCSVLESLLSRADTGSLTWAPGALGPGREATQLLGSRCRGRRVWV